MPRNLLITILTTDVMQISVFQFRNTQKPLPASKSQNFHITTNLTFKDITAFLIYKS